MATPSGNSFKILQLSLGARLRAIGGLEQGQLVAGPWGDLSTSSDLHLLLWLFAEQRCAAMGRARGWEGDPDVLLGKSDGRGSALYECDSASCLLERLSQLLPGLLLKGHLCHKIMILSQL